MALGIVNSMQLLLSGQNNWEQLSIFKLLRTSELKAGRTVCWSFLSQPAVALLHQLLIVKAHRQAMAIQHFTQYTYCTNCEHARASIARTPWIHSRTFHKFIQILQHLSSVSTASMVAVVCVVYGMCSGPYCLALDPYLQHHAAYLFVCSLFIMCVCERVHAVVIQSIAQVQVRFFELVSYKQMWSHNYLRIVWYLVCRFVMICVCAHIVTEYHTFHILLGTERNTHTYIYIGKVKKKRGPIYNI